MLDQCIIQTEAYSNLLGLDLSFQSAACPKSTSLKVHNKHVIHIQTVWAETTMGLKKMAFKHTLHKTRDEAYITCLRDD